MIFKSSTKTLSIKGAATQSVAVSGVLDVEQLYKDLTSSGYTIERALFERSLLELDENSQYEANFILVPGIYKTGAIAVFNTDTHTFIELTFSRPSHARYIDRYGNLRISEKDEPRMSYDVIYKNCKGYTFEKGAVNLIPRSCGGYTSQGTSGFTAEESDLSGWGTILTKYAGTASAANFHDGLVQQGSVYSYSAYVKINDGVKPTQDMFKIYLGSEVIQDFTINYLTQGIYRLEASATTLKLRGANRVGIEVLPSIITRKVRLYGEQLEYGLSVSSYIETNGVMKARMADKFVFDSDQIVFKELVSRIKESVFNLKELVVFTNTPENNYTTTIK